MLAPDPQYQQLACLAYAGWFRAETALIFIIAWPIQSNDQSNRMTSLLFIFSEKQPQLSSHASSSWRQTQYLRRGLRKLLRLSLAFFLLATTLLVDCYCNQILEQIGNLSFTHSNKKNSFEGRSRMSNHSELFQNCSRYKADLHSSPGLRYHPTRSGRTPQKEDFQSVPGRYLVEGHRLLRLLEITRR